MTQGEWVKENLFQSKTFYGAAFLELLALVLWIICIWPKDLAAWVAIVTASTTIIGGWIAANKVQSGINAGITIARETVDMGK